MKKCVIFFATMFILINISYAELFPNTKTVTHNIQGINNFRVYDGVGNLKTINLDRTSPTVSTPTYSGDNYQINISDVQSGIWKVVDDTGTYEVNDARATWNITDYDATYDMLQGTFSKSMYGVNQITVYDNAGNSTTVTLEKNPPEVTTPTYSNGKFSITVQDGIGESGIWKVTHGQNEWLVGAGEISKDKIPEESIVCVYDKANNVTCVNLTNDRPKIVRIDKKSNSNNIKMVVSDEAIDLWKVTETIGGSPIEVGGVAVGALSGRSQTIEFSTASQYVYVYNHAGNYTRAKLSEYESNVFDNEKEYTIRGITCNTIDIYDGVGNIQTINVDRIPPTVSTPTYSGDNYVIQISDTGSGIWKVVDDDGTYEVDAQGATWTKTATTTTDATTGNIVTYDMVSGTFSKSMYGITFIDVYDNANNKTTVHLEQIPPTVSTPTYSGDNYVIQISDTDSGIWKVEDDNGTYIITDAGNNTWNVRKQGTNEIYQVTAGTFSHSIYNVTYIKVYDKAGNTTIVTPEQTPPTVGTPIYSEGTYTIAVSDSESGLWKVKDSRGEENITSSSITRPKVNGQETVYVYDKAGNITTLGLTTIKPKIVNLTKRVNSLVVNLTASDSSINLWKVTEGIGQDAIETLSGRKDTIEFTLSDPTVRKIYVYNQAGNYTEVTLSEYEISNFGTVETRTFSMASISGQTKKIKIYDAVNNVREHTLDSQGPNISEPTYREGKYTITVSDLESGVWKVVDTNGTYETGDGIVTRPKVNGAETIHVYDHAGNISDKVLTTSVPQVTSLTKKVGNRILLTTTDSNVDLWKVTESIGGDLVAELSGTSCTVDFTLSSDSIQTIYIYNHAGNYISINLNNYQEATVNTDDSTNPELGSGAYKNSAGTGFKITVEDAALSKITKDDGTTLIKNIYGISCTTNFEVQSEITGFKVYDEAGNHIDVSVENFAVDDDEPDVSVSGNNVTMADSESGLWKVTNYDGSVILRDFTGTYPTVSTVYEVSQEDDIIRVYDAVGNYQVVDLRRQISSGTVSISSDEPRGIKVTGDAAIEFTNTDKISIGRNDGVSPGIEVASGVTLTINNNSDKVINIYGGRNGKIKCAGIYVPPTSTLHLTGSGTMNVYGNSNGSGTGAGIGGNGITIDASGVSTDLTNAGTIRISSGVVNAYGGCNNTVNCYGTGAGIGGGGIYNKYITGDLAGSNLGNIIIDGTATVTAQGGYAGQSGETSYSGYGMGAGIGGGGICNTVATNVTGGNLKDGLISSSNKVIAKGGYVLGSYGYGMGAGLGGGGVHNTQDNATVSGGSLEKLIITSSDLEAVGGCGSKTNSLYGTGAGIGGGGVSSTQDSIVYSGQSIGLRRYKNTDSAKEALSQDESINSDIRNSLSEYGMKISRNIGALKNKVRNTHTRKTNASKENSKMTNKFAMRAMSEKIPTSIEKKLSSSNSVRAMSFGKPSYSAQSVEITKGRALGLQISDINEIDATKGTAQTVQGDAANIGDGGVYNNGQTQNAEEYLDLEAPVINSVYKNQEGTMFRIDVTDNKYLSKITKEDNTLIKEIEGENAKTQFSINKTLDPNFESFKIYDALNNVIVARNFTVDNTNPTVSVSYSGSNYTLTMQDTESGIWKIVSNNQELVNYDNQQLTYSGQLPTTEVTYTGSMEDQVVYVYDGVGNITTVYIDNQAPVLKGIYRMQDGYHVIVEDARNKVASVQYKDGTNDWVEVSGIDGTNKEEAAVVPLSQNTILIKAADTNGNEMSPYTIPSSITQIDIASVSPDKTKVALKMTGLGTITKLSYIDESGEEYEVQGIANVSSISQSIDTPNGATKLKVYYSESNTLINLVEDGTKPSISDMYFPKQGTIRMTIEDANGLKCVKYYVDSKVSETWAIANLETSYVLDIPDNTYDELEVVDGCGNTTSKYSLQNIERPLVTNVYSTGENEISLEVNDIEEVYYLDENGQKIVLYPKPGQESTDGTIQIEMPSSESIIYIKGEGEDENDPPTRIEIDTTNLVVNKALQDKQQILVDIVSSGTITKIEYVNASGTQLGELQNLEANATSVTGLKNVPKDTVALRIYVNGESYDVSLEQHEMPPTISSVYKTQEGKLSVTLEDIAGLSKIEYYINGSKVEDTTGIANQTRTVKEIILDPSIARIRAYNVFGESSTFDISELKTIVYASYVNATRSKARLYVEGDSEIETLSYISKVGTLYKEPVNQNEYNGTFDTKGANKVTVNYRDGDSVTISLVQDTDTTIMSNAYISEGKYIATFSDESGISKIIDGSNEITYKPPENEVIATLNGTSVYVYDGVGNKFEPIISGFPTIQNMYIDKDNQLSVDTTGIAKIYYYENGEKVYLDSNVTNGHSNIEKTNQDIYFETNDQKEILVSLANDIPVVSKAVVNGTTVVLDLDTEKEVIKAVFYSASNDTPLGTVYLNNDIINEPMTVPAGVARVVVEYKDGTTTKFVLETHQDTASTDTYKSDEEIVLNLENKTGIDRVEYMLGGEAYTVNLDDVTSAEVRIPQEATNIVVFDSLGLSTNMTIPQDTPEVSNIQKNEEGNILIDSTDDLYYIGPDNQEHTAQIDPSTQMKIIPSGIETVYTKESGEKDVEISLKDVSVSIENASVNSDGTKISLNVESDKKINKVEYYNGNNELLDTWTLVGNIYEINEVRDVPEGAAYVKVIYEDDKETKVILKEDENEPVASNVMKKGDNILVTLEDQAGISKVEYYDKNGDKQTINITGNPASITQELEMEEGVTTILVYDVFGNVKVVDVSNITPEVHVAKISQDGSLAVFKISGDKQIDEIIIGGQNVLDNPALEFGGVEEANGQDLVLLKYHDKTFSEVELSEDSEAPEVNNLYIKDGILKMEISDDAGLQKVMDDEGRVIESYNTIILSDTINETTTADKIYVYDNLGNIKTITLSEVDQVGNMYRIDSSTISVDTNSTLYYYDTKGNKVLINNPHSVKLESGVTSLFMEDANGNEIEIQIPNNMATITNATKNSAGTKISLGVTSKTVSSIICYDANGEELCTIEGQSIGEVMDVSKAGVTQIEIVYTDHTTNNVTLATQVPPSYKDVYVEKQGEITFTAESNTGLEKVTYTLNGSQQESISGTIAKVTVPSDATDIKIYDKLDELVSVIVPQTIPEISNVQKDKAGDTLVDIEEDVYYKDKDGEEHEASRDEDGRAIIPPDVTEVYTKVGQEVGTVIDLGNVTVAVENAQIKGNKISFIMENEDTIQNVICYDASGNAIGDPIPINGEIINDVLDVPEGTAKIAVMVSGKDPVEVILKEDNTTPVSNNVTKKDDKILVTLQDESGISKIEYYDKNGVLQTITITGNPTSITKELNIDSDRIRVYDSLGNMTQVNLANPSTEILVATKNQDKISFSVSSGKTISSIAANDKVILVNAKTYDGMIQENNASSVIITYQDGTKSTVELTQDLSEPSIKNVYIKDSKLEMTIEDVSGIDKIVDSYGKVLEKYTEFTSYKEEKLSDVSGVIYVYDRVGNVAFVNISSVPTIENTYVTSDGKLHIDTDVTTVYIKDGDQTTPLVLVDGVIDNIPDGVTKVYLEDSSGNEIEIDLSDVSVVSKAVVSQDGTKLALEPGKEANTIICYDENGEEIGRITGEDIKDVMDVPQGTESIDIVYQDGDVNKMQIDTQGDAEFGNAYKNGSQIIVELESEAGLQKVVYEDGSGKTHEIYLEGEKETRVELPDDAVNIKVVDMLEQETQVDIDDIPQFSDIQEDEDGNTIVTSSDPLYQVVEIGGIEYYVMLEEKPPQSGRYVIPSEEPVYIIPVTPGQDPEEQILVPSNPGDKPTQIILGSAGTKVITATVSQDRTKVYLNVESDRAIQNIISYNENDLELGRIPVNLESVNDVFDVSTQTEYVSVKYQDGTETKILLNDDDGNPKVLDKISMPNGDVAITLCDNASIDKIEYYDKEGKIQTISMKERKTDVTKVISLPDEVTKIQVYDGFSNMTKVDVGQKNTTIDKAYVYENSALIDIQSDNTIKSINYVDKDGVNRQISVNGLSYNQLVLVDGATEIIVVYDLGQGEETQSRIPLTEYNKTPKIKNAYITDGILKMEVESDVGLAKVVNEEGNVIEDYGNMMKTQDSLSTLVQSGMNQIYVYDRFGKMTMLYLPNVPIVQNIYKNASGSLSIDTDEIANIYYYDADGQKVMLDNNPDGTSVVNVPDGITTIYLETENGDHVEMTIDDAPQISSAAISSNGEKITVGLDPTKTVNKIMCYDENGNKLGEITGDDIKEVMDVPEYTESIEIVYSDGTINKIVPASRESSTTDNIYKSSEDTIMVTVESNTGLIKVTYEYPSNTEHEILLNGELKAQVELPIGAENVRIIDKLGETPFAISQNNIPEFLDIQSDQNGNTIINSNYQLYYEGENGEELLVPEDSYERYIVPAGVTEVYTKDNNEEVDIILDLTGNKTIVNRAVVNGDGTKVVLDIDAWTQISKLVMYDDKTELGKLDINASSINNVLTTKYGTSKIKLLYQNGGETNVELQSDDGSPSVYNVVKLEDGKVMMTITDVAGIQSVCYYDSNGECQTPIQVTGLPKKLTTTLTLPEYVDRVLVYDGFLNVTVVDVKNIDVYIKTSKASTDYSKAILDIESNNKPIVQITYESGSQEVNDTKYYGLLSQTAKRGISQGVINKINIMYQDGTSSEITLSTDNQGPEIKNAYRYYDKIILTTEDIAGIEKITDGDGKVLKRYNQLAKKVSDQKVDYYEGTIVIYDNLGNTSQISTATLPTVQNMYKIDDNTIKAYVLGNAYYKDANDNNVNLQDGVVTIPVSVGTIYVGDDMEIEIPNNLAKITNAAINQNGTKVALGITSPKTISAIIGYDTNGQELSRITGANIGEVMDVSVGVTSIGILYNDDTLNKVDLTPQSPPTYGNMYKPYSDDTVAITTESVAGLDYMQYVSKNGTIETVDLTGETTAEVPEGATSIILVDKLGQQTNVQIPQDVPEINNATKDEEGNITVESDEPLYIKEVVEGVETYTPIQECPPGSGKYEIPPEVEYIYAMPSGFDPENPGQDPVAPVVEFNLSQVTLTVKTATINSNGTKIALDLESEETIQSVLCYDKDDNLVGTISIGSPTINDVLIIPQNTKNIKLLYQDGKKNDIVLTRKTWDTELSDLVSLGDDKIMMVLIDEAGISEISYYEGQTLNEILIEDNPTSLTKKLDLPRGVNEVRVHNRFGDVVTFDIRNATTNVKMAKTNNGKAVIEIESQDTILKVSYVNELGVIVDDNEVTDQGTKYYKVIDVSGDSITVSYDGKTQVIGLELYNGTPLVWNVKNEFEKLTLDMKDDIGIEKITDENGRILKTYNQKVTEITERINISKDVTGVYVYNRLGNRTRVDIDAFPTVDNVYKTPDNKVSVYTDGVKEIYYYNDNNEKVTLDAAEPGETLDGEVKLSNVPEGAELHFSYGEEEDSVIVEISQSTQTIEKAIIGGEGQTQGTTKVLVELNPPKLIEKIICYDENDQEIDEVEKDPTQSGNGINQVQKGTKKIRIVYSDGSNNKVLLSDYNRLEQSNIYISDDLGTKTLKLDQNAGMVTLRYSLDNGITYESIDLRNVTYEEVEIPNGATNIEVIDALEENTPITMPQSIPTLRDVQINKDEQVVITSSVKLYYKDQNNVEQEVPVDTGTYALSAADGVSRYIAPSGIEEVYIKEADQEPVSLDISVVPTKIVNAVVNSTNTKVALNLSTSKELEELMCYDQNGLLIDTTSDPIELEGIALNQAITVPSGTKKVKLKYTDDKTTEILLNQDNNPPVCRNKVKLETGTMLLDLQDVAGISKIEYNGLQQPIQIHGNPTSIVQELKLPDNVKQVTVKDIFEDNGDEASINLADDEMDTIFESHATGANGNKALLTLYGNKQITKIEYAYDNGTREILEDNLNSTSYDELVNVYGADKIIVTYHDNTSMEVPLQVDDGEPEHSHVMVNEDRTKYKMIIEDKRGISKVFCGEEEMELPNRPKQVIVKLELPNVEASSLRFNKLDDEPNSDIQIDQDGCVIFNVENENEEFGGVDALGNSMTGTTLRSLSEELTEDNKGPTYEIKYHNCKYILKLEDPSGLGSVIGKNGRNVVHEITNYPTEYMTEASDNPTYEDPENPGNQIEETALIAIDGVGNETEIVLVKNDNDGPEILWKYKRGNCIYVGLHDTIGVDRVEDQQHDTRLTFVNTPKDVTARYELREKDVRFYVYDVFNNPQEVSIADVTLEVLEAYRNLGGDKIILTMRDNTNEILRVEYLDGDYDIVQQSSQGVRKMYEVPEGTTYVKVYQEDAQTHEEICTIVKLDLDAKGPEVKDNLSGGHLYVRGRNSEGERYAILKAKDETAGISQIVVGEGEPIQITGIPTEIMEQVLITGAETMRIYDGLGNVTTINLNTVTEDTQNPTGTIVYRRDTRDYLINLNDNESGIWKLVKNGQDVIKNYSEYIQEENSVYSGIYPSSAQQTIPLSNMLGITRLEVYDAVGNVSEIDLRDVLCIISYVYINQAGNRMVVNAQDIRGIEKLGIVYQNQEEDIIEVFAPNTTMLRKSYKIPTGVVSICIHSAGGKITDYDVTDLFDTTQNAVLENKVYSPIGISRILYDDGNEIEFRKDTPVMVMVDLTNHEQVEVYDTLGNVVMLPMQEQTNG